MTNLLDKMRELQDLLSDYSIRTEDQYIAIERYAFVCGPYPNTKLMSFGYRVTWDQVDAIYDLRAIAMVVEEEFAKQRKMFQRELFREKNTSFNET